MLLVQIYQYLIFLIVGVWTFLLCQQYKQRTFDISRINVSAREYAVAILAIFLTFLIGLRPLGQAWMWADTVNYKNTYDALEGNVFYFDANAINFIWDNLFNYWASAKLGISNLFLLGDAIYFICTYLACKKWFPHDTTAAYLVFLGAFSTYSYSFNGVKAGIAGAIFLLGLAYYKNKWISIILVLISWGFHHSMQLPVVAYTLGLFFKSPKWYFYGWGICVLMALLHVSYFQSLFSGFTDEQGQSYLNVISGDDFGGKGGFRIDFLLYSAAPVYFGYKFIIKEGRKVSDMYRTIMNMYLCTNGIWCLCMYASYCNRIAYLSWFMYPIVLIYPFLKEDLSGSPVLKRQRQYKFFSKVMVYHLGFTLFMELIVYNFLK